MRPRKERDEDDGQDRDFVTALARGLELLRAFGREGESLGNRDFSERTGLSKSTVSRLTYTLQKLEYLSYNPDTARYQLAPPVLSLGFSCLAGMPLRQLANLQTVFAEGGTAARRLFTALDVDEHDQRQAGRYGKHLIQNANRDAVQRLAGTGWLQPSAGRSALVEIKPG